MRMPNGPSSNDMLSVQPFEAPLRGVVDRIERQGHQPADGRRRDDRAGSLLAEVRQERLGRPDHPEKVGVDLARELIVGDALERAREAVAGVVEEHVDATEGDRLLRCRGDLRPVGDIELQHGDARRACELDVLSAASAWWR